MDNDMYLLMTVADIGLPKREMEKFARAVVYIHSEKGVDLLPLLNYLLSDEVRTHGTLHVLARSSLLMFSSGRLTYYCYYSYSQSNKCCFLEVITLIPMRFPHLPSLSVSRGCGRFSTPSWRRFTRMMRFNLMKMAT